MDSALQAIQTGEMGYKAAAKQFGVPKTTLKRRHKDGNKTAKGSMKSLGRYKMVFSTEMESIDWRTRWLNKMDFFIHSRMRLLEKTV